MNLSVLFQCGPVSGPAAVFGFCISLHSCGSEVPISINCMRRVLSEYMLNVRR